jgi:hypothetical protein
VVYMVQIQHREILKLLMNSQHPLYFLAEAIPKCIYITVCNCANNHVKHADGLYNFMVDDKDGQIH